MNGITAVPLILITATALAWGFIEHLKRCKLEDDIHFWARLAVKAIVENVRGEPQSENEKASATLD